jgi:hypothetical protein
MAATAFRVTIFLPNLVKLHDLFKIWKLGHTHTYTYIMAVMWICFFLQGRKSAKD